jgi:hypothetical protein
MGPEGLQGAPGLPGEGGGVSNLAGLAGVTLTGKYLPLDSVSRQYNFDWAHETYTSRLDVPTSGNLATIYEIDEFGQTVAHIWVPSLNITQADVDNCEWVFGISGGAYVPVYLTSDPESYYASTIKRNIFWDGSVAGSGTPIITWLSYNESGIYEDGKFTVQIPLNLLGNNNFTVLSIKEVSYDSIIIDSAMVVENTPITLVSDASAITVDFYLSGVTLPEPAGLATIKRLAIKYVANGTE